MSFRKAYKRLISKATTRGKRQQPSAGDDVSQIASSVEEDGSPTSATPLLATTPALALSQDSIAGGPGHGIEEVEGINELNNEIGDDDCPESSGDTGDCLISPQALDLEEMVTSQLADGPSVNTEPPTDARTPVYMFEGASNIIQGGTFNAAGRDIIYNIQSSEEQSKIARSLSNCISDLASGGQQVAKMLKWLSPINFRLAFEENLTKWTPGTGSRVLKSDSFERWLHAKNVVLCGTGMPGAGKTVLASLIISTISKPNGQLVAFIYCRYTEPLSVQDILAAVIRQILEDHQQLVALLRPLFDHHSLRNTRPTQGDLLGLLKTISVSFPTAHFLLDGLDEAHPDIQYELVKALDSLGGNLMITSRPIPLLKQVLPDAIFFDVIADKDDIASLVSQRIEMNPAFLELLTGAGAKEAVISKIREKSQGMFLHAALQIELVRRCTSLKSVMKQLDAMPAKLEEMYTLTVQRIEKQFDDPDYADLAKRALLWVIYSEEPLTLEELRYAVACTDENEPFDETDVVPESTLLSACAGLISTEGKRHTPRLIHYTAKTALASILARDYPNPHTLLAQGCVIYLKTYAINDITAKRLTQSYKGLPFLSYALHHWASHAQQCNGFSSSATSPSSGRSFLLSCRSYPLGWYPWMSSRSPTMATSSFHIATFYNILHLVTDVIRPEEDGVISTPLGRTSANVWPWGTRTPLMFSVSRNHLEAVDRLLVVPHIQVNAQGLDGSTALLLACSQGDRRAPIIQRLLKHHDSNPNMADASGRTPLLACLLSENRKEQTFQLLLHSPGIDVNKSDSDGRSPLLYACKSGILPIILDLLAHPDIDVNKPDLDGRTPLMEAVECCKDSAAHALLDHPSIQANRKSERGETTLMIASYRGNVEIAKRLMGDPGIEVNARCHGRDHTALTLANSEEMMLLLLDIPGVDVNATRDGLSAIAIAAMNGWERAMARLLLFPELDVTILPTLANTEADMLECLDRPGIDINARHLHGHSAFTLASSRGWIHALKRLLEFPDVKRSAVNEALVSCGTEETMIQLLRFAGVEVNTKRKDGKTPLILASRAGWLDGVRELLENPALDADASDNDGKTALMLARNEEMMLQLLSVRGLDINKHSEDGETALMLACEVGWEMAVEAMATHPKIELNATDSNGVTALMSAVEQGSERIVRLLLGGNQVEVNTQDVNGKTALRVAAGLGHGSIVKLLTDYPGTDVNIKDGTGMTALLTATLEGHEAIALHLLGIPGVRCNDRDDKGKTPLMHAAENDLDEAVARLLDNPEVDVNAKDDQAWAALVFATWGGSEEAFRKLVACPRVDVNTRTGSQMTPLMFVSAHLGAMQIWGDIFVTLLLQRPDIDVNATNAQGKTALALAVGGSPAALIRQLLRVPSLDVNIKDSNGWTPLMIASQGYSRVTRFALRSLLASPTINVNAMDNNGKTALDLVRGTLRSKTMYEAVSDFFKQTEQLLSVYPGIANSTDPYFDSDLNEIEYDPATSGLAGDEGRIGYAHSW
ncbi:ankyrin repeat-containing domain protein [Coprinopsis sp. MPI-PUGE-AT-0042]|nr:ankyrin repeat-containing domain protein [Coprinopsis sp. MPI-PUGE-AT-0042]